MGLAHNRYVYIDDLQLSASVHACVGASSPYPSRPSPSPVRVDRLALCLASYPDQRFVSYLLAGLSQGFRVGASGSLVARHSVRNHLSCSSSPAAVNSYIISGRAAGRLWGPLPSSAGVHLSPIGLVPKGHSGEAWRMIVDLCHPRGHSVNDLIPSDLCSLSYPAVDDAVDYILFLGRYTGLVKIDLKSAYRLLPIHPLDRRLLGISWDGHVFFG